MASGMESGEQAPPVMAPPLPGPAVLRQVWAGVVFLHWPVDPARVTHLFPPGTRPDLFDGTTYVGLVAFHAPTTRLLGIPALGAFDEVNVRLYSVDGQGRRGVVFLTMDADSLHGVLVARTVPRMPYTWSDTSLRQCGPGVSAGAVRRRWPQGGAWGRWSLRVEDRPTNPSPLEHFLTARWGLHSPWAGATLWARVHHRPWVLHHAVDVTYEGDLLARAGVRLPHAPPTSVLWSPGTVADLTPSTRPVR